MSKEVMESTEFETPVEHRYPQPQMAPAYLGMGGYQSANSAFPFHGSTLYDAIRTDPGLGQPTGKAPGLNPAYGNVGNNATMVYDRTVKEKQQ